MESVFFHIDVNSAFLSWTSVAHIQNHTGEDLRLIPAIIGGDMEKRHGVVLAKSIPAKKFHIKTGEPIVNAFRKCPNLVVAPPNHPLYQDYSQQLFSFLSDICPDIEQLSIDECFMDFTPISANYTSPVKAACSIKDAILETFGFTVNIGISDRKVLAKMASDFQKPNLVHTLYQSEIKEKLWPLPISDLYMCGRSAAETLQKLGIVTIGDLAASELKIIVSHLKSHGKLLWDYANGIDDSAIHTVPAKPKGIGNSITLSKDALTFEDARPALLHLAESVSERLRTQGYFASMISVEIKYSTFQCVSHQRTLSCATHATEEIYQNACALFQELWSGAPIRLLGIRTSRLTARCEPVQLNLFDMAQETQKSKKQVRLDRAVDSIRDKFGADAVIRGSLLNKKDSFKKH